MRAKGSKNEAKKTATASQAHLLHTYLLLCFSGTFTLKLANRFQDVSLLTPQPPYLAFPSLPRLHPPSHTHARTQTHTHTHTHKCGVTWCGRQRQNVCASAPSASTALRESRVFPVPIWRHCLCSSRHRRRQASPYLHLHAKSFPRWITCEYANMGCRYFVFRLIWHWRSQIAPLHKKRWPLAASC